MSKPSTKQLQDELFFGAPFTADHYPRNSRVRVLRGDRKGELATVTRTYADGGDMVHRVVFHDGTTADYDVTEITQHGQPTSNT